MPSVFLSISVLTNLLVLCLPYLHFEILRCSAALTLRVCSTVQRTVANNVTAHRPVFSFH